MSGQQPAQYPAGLTADQNSIGALRSTFTTAADEVQALVTRCRRELFVHPAMGDPASVDFADYLNDFHTGPVGSVLATLTDYLAQLRRVADTLAAIETSYPRNEADVVEALTRATS